MREFFSYIKGKNATFKRKFERLQNFHFLKFEAKTKILFENCVFENKDLCSKTEN